MLFINGDVPSAMIISLHLFIQFMYNYWIRNETNNDSHPDIVILSNNKEDFNNNNDEENNNIYVAIPEVVNSNKRKTVVLVKKFKMSDIKQEKEDISDKSDNSASKTELKSVLKPAKEGSPETGVCVKCHQNVVDKFDNQPFAPIHLKAVEEMPDIAISTVFGTPDKDTGSTSKKRVHYYGDNSSSEGTRNPLVKFSNRVQKSVEVENKEEDLFFQQTGRTADSGLVLNDVIDEVPRFSNGDAFNPKVVKKERRESIKKDRLDISYHLELFNDGPLVPETPKTPELDVQLTSPPKKKVSSPPFMMERATLFKSRVHKVSNPLIAPSFQPTIQIDNYDSASPPHPPSTPTFTEIPTKTFDTPASSASVQRDSRSVSPNSTFNAQKTWYDIYDRIRRHEDLPLPPTRQTRSYESLQSSIQIPSTLYGPPQTLTPSNGARVRKISTPNPPTQPMMKSIDISNLGYNDDLVESDRRWTMSHDGIGPTTMPHQREEPTFERIKQRSRKISRNRRPSIMDPPAPAVIYKCIYSFRSANTIDTQCSCNVIVVNFDTFNDREVDAEEIESKYFYFYEIMNF